MRVWLPHSCLPATYLGILILFQVSVLGCPDPVVHEIAYQYGKNVGIAFQVGPHCKTGLLVQWEAWPWCWDGGAYDIPFVLSLANRWCTGLHLMFWADGQANISWSEARVSHWPCLICLSAGRFYTSPLDTQLCSPTEPVSSRQLMGSLDHEYIGKHLGQRPLSGFDPGPVTEMLASVIAHLSFICFLFCKTEKITTFMLELWGLTDNIHGDTLQIKRCMHLR